MKGAVSDTVKLSREWLSGPDVDQKYNGDLDTESNVKSLAALLARVVEEERQRGNEYHGKVLGQSLEAVEVEWVRVVRESCTEKHAHEVFRRMGRSSEG